MPIYSYKLPSGQTKRVEFDSPLTEEEKVQIGVTTFGEGTVPTAPESRLQRAVQTLRRPYSTAVGPALTRAAERTAESTPSMPWLQALPSLIPQTEEEFAIPPGMAVGGRAALMGLKRMPRFAQWLGQVLGGTGAAAGTSLITGRDPAEEAGKGALGAGAGATAGLAAGPLRRHGPPTPWTGKRRVAEEMAGDVGRLAGASVPEFGTPRTGQQLFDLFGTKAWKEILSVGYGRRLNALAAKLPGGMDTIVDAPILQHKLPPVLREVVERVETPLQSMRTVRTFKQPDVENLPGGMTVRDLGLEPEMTTTVTETGGMSVKRPLQRLTQTRTQAVTTREGEVVREEDLAKRIGPETRELQPLTLREAERRLDALSDVAQWGADSPTERAIMAREAFWQGRDQIREALRGHGGDALAGQYDEMNRVYKIGVALSEMFGHPSQYHHGRLMTGETQKRLTAGAAPQRDDWERRVGTDVWKGFVDKVFRGKPLTYSDVEGLGLPGIARLYAIETPTGIKARAGLAAPHRSVFPQYIAAPGRKPLEPTAATKDIISTLTEMGFRRATEETPVGRREPSAIP